MSENNYRKLTERIHTPAGLSERVLAAAGTHGEPAGAAARPQTRKRRVFWRAAVCAACALALVAGTWTVHPEDQEQGKEDGAPLTALPVFSFGLTAYAADTGERTEPNANGGLAFRAGNGAYWSEPLGYYTECLLQVTGDHIQSVTLTLDRGEFYQLQILEEMTAEERAAWEAAKQAGLAMPGTLIETAEDGTEYSKTMLRLGSTVSGDYDPSACYGFWVPSPTVEDWKADRRAAAREKIDLLDGACLTAEITFTDGSTQSKTYRLSTGKLREETAADGTTTLLPALAGDETAVFYGVYAESETEGRWLEWPVQGANTIRTSNSFGGRWQPGGKSQVFHWGIDIPADAGSPVLAAADGTVAEIGFDSQRGNYVVLDHGGGLETRYGQCRDILDRLAEGDAVSAGEMIGAVGSTGLSTGPHLHFEVRQDGEPQNPVVYFSSAVRDTLRMG